MVFIFIKHFMITLNNSFILIAVFGVRSRLTLAHVRQMLLAGLPGGFSPGSPIFAPATDWTISYELK